MLRDYVFRGESICSSLQFFQTVLTKTRPQVFFILATIFYNSKDNIFKPQNGVSCYDAPTQTLDTTLPHRYQ